MKFIHGGKEIDTDSNVLLDKWLYEEATGDKPVQKPEMCIFRDIDIVCQMLNKHLNNKSRISLHVDVDVDGIGSGYILKKMLRVFGVDVNLMLINKEKVHGIMDKHVDYFNKNNPADLLIISDSSSNEIDLIKQFNCDVLVIDHHEVLHDDLVGKCNDGIHEYIIMNNTLDNNNFERSINYLKSKNCEAFKNITEYKGESRMSCGLVIYELWRVYCECFGNPQVLENLLLFQWAGVTLLTDSIQLLNERNLWYMDKTVHFTEVEPTLDIMQDILTRSRFGTRFKTVLDKTYINYTFAPVINKAIRASHSTDALGIVMNDPKSIATLNIYKKLQEEAINKVVYSNYEYIENLKKQYIELGWTEDAALQDMSTRYHIVTDLVARTFDKEYIAENISDRDISPNYTGVIAGRLCGEHTKNTACYVINDKNKAKGSFRGRNTEADYRKFFEDYNSDIYAQGHPQAFGFECSVDELSDIMGRLNEIENDVDNREFFSYGNMPDEEKGVYHILDFDEFKKAGYLLRLGIGNSQVNNKYEVCIKVPASEVVLKEVKGKLYLYNVLGLECKSFKQLSGQYFKIYAEFTTELNTYVR